MRNNRRKIALVNIKGGLGNQMFIYAFCLFLKSKGYYIKPIWFSFLYIKHHHGVELFDNFELEGLFDNNGSKFFITLSKLLRFRILNRILHKLIKIFIEFRYKTIKQEFPYSNLNYDYKDNQVYFDGFWQNYSFVDSIQNELRKQFVFRLPQSGNYIQWRSKIKDCEAVSIHIRKGDYLNKEFSDLNVIKTLDYYYKAIEIIHQSVNNTKFFIFTDDLKWVKANFKLDGAEYVEGNSGNEAYLDMYLMSECKHNIICNSTFSWWGAYLNKNHNKIVIAPSEWTTNYSSSYICPDNWIFLKP